MFKKFLVICILSLLVLVPVTSHSTKEADIVLDECITECVKKYDIVILDENYALVAKDKAEVALECLGNCINIYEQMIDEYQKDQTNDRSDGTKKGEGWI